MNQTTKKLASIYRLEGKHELAEAVEDCYKSLTRLSNLISEVWAVTEHRCPTCGGVIINHDEWEFACDSGTCFRCDHILSDCEKGGDIN